jgi:mono/diheme cytochrome c family protein
MKNSGFVVGLIFAGVLITASVYSQNPAPPAPPPEIVPSAPPMAPPPALIPPSAGANTLALPPNSPPPTVASKPVFVPDVSRSGQPLPNGILAWDSLMKSTDVLSGADFAHFSFSFTNISGKQVTVLNIHPSCGCTTAQMPPVPWTIPAGATGEFKLNVNLAGKFGTVFKSAKVTTDQGNKDLMLKINIQVPPPVKLTDAQIDQGIAMAKADRQAVFKGDCASCHDKNISGRYGQDLFNNVCGICHASPNRATMVPDLTKLKVPTNREFWRTWITYGKPGSLMPAFSTSQGGPLTDMQIASLAAYLNAVYPSKVATIQ